jgi:hypothetical protein
MKSNKSVESKMIIEHSQHAREIALKLSVKRELTTLDMDLVAQLWDEYHFHQDVADIIRYRLWRMPIAGGAA